jgi:hypothetical protein
LLTDLDGTIGAGRNERHQVFHLDMRSLQRNAFSIGILEHKTVGFQLAVLFENADPVFPAAA